MASVRPVPCNIPAHRFDELMMIATADSPSQLVPRTPRTVAQGGGGWPGALCVGLRP